ncbi:MAG: type I methionyl aminopeptidase [Christensenellales bacterium]|jgi:methionyl aminopeptidase
MTLKSPQEIAIMRQAGAITRGALAAAKDAVRPGVTTLAIDRIVEDYIRAAGAVPSFKGYGGFPGSACVSVNDEVVHGIPGDRVLKEGDIVSIDVGAIYKGFHGDAARTYPVGRISADAQRLIDVTRQCFYEGIRYAKVGYRLGDIGAAIQSYAEAAGFSVVRELIGHGVGRNLHEPPDVPNYGVPGRGLRLQQGMTLAVEPMINAGTRKVRTLEDGWTVVTADGAYSAHYENSIAITDGEPLILTVM